MSNLYYDKKISIFAFVFQGLEIRNKAKNKKIEVKGVEVVVYNDNDTDYISLTDIARYKDAAHIDDIIKNWMRNRNTIELLGFWEMMYNPNSKPVEFDGFRKQAGLNSFVMTPKRWIETTNAIGIVSKAGRYGGTFAHKDIALEFASWISIEFKLYVIKEFQRLKEEESNRNQLEWNLLGESAFILAPPLFVDLIGKLIHSLLVGLALRGNFQVQVCY